MLFHLSSVVHVTLGLSIMFACLLTTHMGREFNLLNAPFYWIKPHRFWFRLQLTYIIKQYQSNDKRITDARYKWVLVLVIRRHFTKTGWSMMCGLTERFYLYQMIIWWSCKERSASVKSLSKKRTFPWKVCYMSMRH